MVVTVALHEHANALMTTGLDRGRFRRFGGKEDQDVHHDAEAPECSLDDFLASIERKAYQVAYYSLSDEQTALDVVQDSMLKLVEKYADRAASEWPALFFTILLHRITDMHRWRRLRYTGGKLISIFRDPQRNQKPENLLDSHLGVALIPEHARPDRETWGAQLRDRIDGALMRLSARQRDVFLLREWHGFGVRETATILGCSEGSVKQHHFRAVRALRVELVEVWNHEKE